MRIERRRTGFTLVELLVAAAVSMGIMYIIGVAFQKSIETFRVLRSTGMMQEKLKSAQMVLKRDLAAEHFGGNFVPGFGGPYVRDQCLDLIGWTPPDEGFFRIINGFTLPPVGGVNQDVSLKDGADSDGLLSYFNMTHSLHFTVKLNGNRDEENFYAAAPAALAALSPSDFMLGSQLSSKWAEVYYFVVPNGQTTPNNEPLFTLYRRQCVALPTSAGVVAWSGGNQTSFPDVSCPPNAATINTSTTLTNPANRMQPVTWPTGLTTTTGVSLYNYGTSRIADINPTLAGDDIVITDVISFEVKVNWSTGTASVGNTSNPASASGGNQDWPFDALPMSTVNSPISPGGGAYAPAVFDTWSKQIVAPGFDWNNPQTWTAAGANPPPYRAQVSSLQIRLRIWDANTQQARQITMVQDI